MGVADIVGMHAQKLCQQGKHQRSVCLLQQKERRGRRAEHGQSGVGEAVAALKHDVDHLRIGIADSVRVGRGQQKQCPRLHWVRAPIHQAGAATGNDIFDLEKLVYVRSRMAREVLARGGDHAVGDLSLFF